MAVSDDVNAVPRPLGDRIGLSKHAIKEEITVAVGTVGDIITARQHGRDLALKAGFSTTESTLIATAISELARNIVLYARTGEIMLASVNSSARRGIVMMARDAGPGIPDVTRALMGGYSTSGGLGLGLSGVRRMVDSLDIDSAAGKGTTVTATKWLR